MTRRVAVALATLSAASGALGALSDTAAAIPLAWSSPVDLTDSSLSARDPRVAVHDAGDSVAVWTRGASGSGDSKVQAASRPAGGAFSAPMDLSPLGTGGSELRIAIGAAGNLVGVWVVIAGSNSAVRAVVRQADGRLSAPVDLSGSDTTVLEAQVAMDQAGDAVAVWTRVTSGPESKVQAAVRPAGGAFSPPQDLSAPGQTSFSPQVAMDRAGNAVVVWSHFAAPDRTVQAAVRNAGGSFSAPFDLSGPGVTAPGPHVAMDRAGDAAVVWERFTQTNSPLSPSTRSVVQAAVAQAAGSFSAPMTISREETGTGPAAYPRVAIGRAGDALAVWRHFDGKHMTLQAATQKAGGGFSAPVLVSGRDAPASDPEVATDQFGDAVVVWAVERGIGAGFGVRGVLRPAGAGFSPPADLSDANEQTVFFPEVAMGGAGDAVAAWTSTSNQPDTYIVRATATIAAAIRNLRVSPSAFVTGPRGGAIARLGTGATISYTHAHGWTTVFTVLSPLPGVRRRGRCVAVPRGRRPPRASRCTRYRTVGRFAHNDRAGRTRFHFTGRLGGRRLARGRYRLAATPRLRGVTGPAATAGFRIVG